MIKETKNNQIYTDSSLSWKTHIDQMMLKLSTACYAIRYGKQFMYQDTLRANYFSYFHSILLYGTVLWHNSAQSYNSFKILESINRIIMNARNRDSCCQLFTILKILPLKSQCIFSLLLFVAKNRHSYKYNSAIHNIIIRFSSDLHTATAKLTTFQKAPFFMESKFLINFFIFLKADLFSQKLRGIIKTCKI